MIEWPLPQEQERQEEPSCYTFQQVFPLPVCPLPSGGITLPKVPSAAKQFLGQDRP